MVLDTHMTNSTETATKHSEPVAWVVYAWTGQPERSEAYYDRDRRDAYVARIRAEGARIIAIGDR